MVREKLKAIPSALGTSPLACLLAFIGVLSVILGVFIVSRADSSVRATWTNFPWVGFYLSFSGIFLALYAAGMSTPRDPKTKAIEDRNGILILLAVGLVIFAMIAISITRGQNIGESLTAGLAGLYIVHVVGFILNVVVKGVRKLRKHRA